MNYFISDTHFGHKNCMAFDNRPFKSIEEHDQKLIDNWNKVVGIDDDVYWLGDISWHRSLKTLEILNQLNGSLHLIRGNHDNAILKNRDIQNKFVEIVDYKELSLSDGKGLVLCHYPIPCFKNQLFFIHFLNERHDSALLNGSCYSVPEKKKAEETPQNPYDEDDGIDYEAPCSRALFFLALNVQSFFLYEAVIVFDHIVDCSRKNETLPQMERDSIIKLCKYYKGKASSPVMCV